MAEPPQFGGPESQAMTWAPPVSDKSYTPGWAGRHLSSSSAHNTGSSAVQHQHPFLATSLSLQWGPAVGVCRPPGAPEALLAGGSSGSAGRGTLASAGDGGGSPNKQWGKGSTAGSAKPGSSQVLSTAFPQLCSTWNAIADHSVNLQISNQLASWTCISEVTSHHLHWSF